MIERRRFLGRVVAGTIGAGAVGMVPTALLAEPADPSTLALARELEQDQAKETWDMNWVDRCTGKYRQVFDAPEIAEGTVFHQARMFMQGFIDVYQAKDPELTAVMVIRHAAIPMAANDRLWDDLELGKRFKLKDPETGKPARRNPFLNANSPANAKYGMLWPDGGLDTLLQRGAIALACNLALFRLVQLVKDKDGSESKAAREKVLANLIPGVVVQPSGVFAVIRAQQAGCHYIRSA